MKAERNEEPKEQETSKKQGRRKRKQGRRTIMRRGTEGFLFFGNSVFFFWSTRMYASYKRPETRCAYTSEIVEKKGKPLFRVRDYSILQLTGEEKQRRSPSGRKAEEEEEKSSNARVGRKRRKKRKRRFFFSLLIPLWFFFFLLCFSCPLFSFSNIFDLVYLLFSCLLGYLRRRFRSSDRRRGSDCCLDANPAEDQRQQAEEDRHRG